MTAFGLVIAEPDVTLTDWVLALEACLLAVLARRHGRAWAAFFGSIGVAALLGGITHGVLAGEGSSASVAVWRMTLLMLGVTSMAAFVAGARALETRAAARVQILAIAGSAAYAMIVLGASDAFVVAIVAYLPATVFLLCVFILEARGGGGRRSLAGAAGIGVLLLGSWLQWRGVALPAAGLTHNAVFHVIEMMALPLIYQGARRW